jgi:lantibiotic leader peptide-processing serine protease
MVTAANGTLVANWPQIGVVIARSADPAFSSAVKAIATVEGVSATAGFGTQMETDETGGSLPGTIPAPSSSTGDSLSGLQWDMVQIHAFDAHAITGGSPSVVVGDIDTGLDFTHPDLAPNYDAAHSADCSTGVPQPLLPGNDHAGHGTHTAGTIAAAANGTGIVGVAPNVKIAGIRAANDDSFTFPEMVICAFMWAGDHGVDITSNSYFADPWMFNCRNDPEQRAIWNAERRAIRYAQSRGTLVVAAEANTFSDLSHTGVDTRSPDYPPDSVVTREVTNACSVIPVEIPGVVGVTATGNLHLKSYFSNYGISTADVAAPGGDAALQITAASPNGRVLSTWPATVHCGLSLIDPVTLAKYCYGQGTSMATPHAAGVAALIMSVTGKAGGDLESALKQATYPQPCPDISLYAPYPQTSGEPQSCQGGTPFNSFYGAGEVDALKAVS